MKKLAILLGLAALGIAGSVQAARTTGPLMSPLKVTSMYLTQSGALYVAFEDGAMPTCYANSGGYLWKTHPNFDEVYAQLLTIVATKGIRGHVVIDTVNPGAGQWSDCNIAGLYLRPVN